MKILWPGAARRSHRAQLEIQLCFGRGLRDFCRHPGPRLALKRAQSLLLLWGTLGAAGWGFAQDNPAAAPPAPSPPTADQTAACEKAAREQLFHDLADFAHYDALNAALPPPGPHERRVVFMGDSITEGWAKLDPEFFARADFVDRGISGQTTPQMLLRFRQDAIALKPAVVHILHENPVRIAPLTGLARTKSAIHSAF